MKSLYRRGAQRVLSLKFKIFQHYQSDDNIAQLSDILIKLCYPSVDYQDNTLNLLKSNYCK